MLSEPPVSTVSLNYQEYYKSKSGGLLSEKEFEALREKEQEYLQEITSPENLRADVEYILGKKLLIIPFLLVVWFLIGFSFRFVDRRYSIAGVFLITALSLLSVNIIESLSYAMTFFIGTKIRK